ncbi:MAG: TonB-dependent receptor [Pseudomonadota bacterium]
MSSTVRVCRAFAAMYSLLLAWPALAADELALYVFDQGEPVENAAVELNGEAIGRTRRDGFLAGDLARGGQNTVTITGPDGKTQRVRFSAPSGQLVDLIADLAQSDDAAVVDVYSRTESAAARRDAPLGTLQVTVRRGAQPVENQLVVISAGVGGVLTNPTGQASSSVRRGVYSVTVDDVSRNVRVVGGITSAVTITLPSDDGIVIAAPQVSAPAIEEVIVLGRYDPSAFESSERDTNLIVDKIDAEQLARFSDSDVAASVARVPGVSIQDDKYVFIRGIGGRYVTTTLNNATMPSTNPSKRTVPLDMFPSNIVRQLDINKTFLPSMPGESTGGNLVINTKTFPDERGGNVFGSLGLITDLTGDTVAVDSRSGNFDWLGWDDGARKESILVSTIGDILQDGGSFTDAQGNTFTLQQDVLRELQRSAGILVADDWDLDFEQTTPNGSFGANYGDLFYFGDSAEFGVYAAVNYSNQWSQRGNGVRRTQSASGLVADDRRFESISNNIDLSGLVSLGLNFGNNTLEMNNVLSRSTESFVERSVGLEGDEFRSVYEHTNQWEERQFISTQFLGSHFLNEDGSWLAEWQISASEARRYMPGRTDVRFNAEANLTDPATLREAYQFDRSNGDQTDILNGFFFSAGGSNRRWDELTDLNFDGSFDFQWDIFDNGSSFSQLRFGAQAIYRERDADSATYGFFNSGADATLSASPNALVSDNIFVCGDGPGTVPCEASGDGSPPRGGVQDNATTGFLFQVRTQVSDEYEAELEYNSLYAMYDHTFNNTWQLVLGARFEQYDQVTDTFELTTGNPVQGVVDEGSFLPSLGLTWMYADNQQIRAAFSRTVARPDFKEASNAVFFDNEFNVRIRGNPNLRVSDVTNADLRWEYYFDSNQQDSVSVALFYKDMADPIERVVQAASGTASNSRTFQNAESAELFGIEVDGRKEFVLSEDYNQTAFIALNAAYIDSETALLSGETRALQGQPEHTANFVLGYDNLSAGHQLTLLFNYTGESIADVGVLGTPNITLQPRGELNIVYQYKLSEAAAIKLQAQNILDAEVEYQQGSSLFQLYEKGVGFQLGFNWNF